MQLKRYQKIGIAGGCMFLFSLIYQNVILPSMTLKNLKKGLALKNGWKMRDIWGKYPFPIEVRFYIFNVTNTAQIERGEKPVLQEVGPFVYDKWQEKSNQEDHEEDDTVSFTFKNTIYFNAEKSFPLTGDEELVLPHFLILGLINGVLREKAAALPVVVRAINGILNKPETVFMRAKAREILFDGIIFDCSAKDFASQAVCNEISSNYETFRLKKVDENIYRLSGYGWMNNTLKERTRVYRGIKDIMNLGKVVEFNNKKNMSYWNDDYCDQIIGTDGTIFHPFLNKKGKDELISFNAGLCRNLKLTYDSKSTFAGFKTLRYTADLGTDPAKNPHDRCYCHDPSNCPKPGVMDLFNCLRSPVFISNPHFYLADSSYRNAVDGLNPEKEKHMIIVDIDPLTGVPLHVHVRNQINLMILKVEKFKLMAEFPEALMPIVWVDELTILPDFLLKDIRNGHTLKTVGKSFQHIFMFGGLAMGAFAVFKHVKSRQKEEKELHEKPEEPKEISNPNSAEKKIPINSIQPAPAPPIID